MLITVPKQLDQATFNRFSQEFKTHDNVSIALPKKLSTNEIRELGLFLLHQMPSDFACVLLADLLEYSIFPVDLLEEVFAKGDIGCRVAVALRDDLPPHIQELCAGSEDDEVRGHYASRLTYRQNLRKSDS